VVVGVSVTGLQRQREAIEQTLSTLPSSSGMTGASCTCGCRRLSGSVRARSRASPTATATRGKRPDEAGPTRTAARSRTAPGTPRLDPPGRPGPTFKPSVGRC